MRKLLLVAVTLLVVHAALLFAGGRGVTQISKPGALNVGIVLDVGGRGDKSFNDGAYAGADSAARILGPAIRFIEPGEGSDREAGLRLLAAEKMDLVIGVGFIFSDDITKLAKEYPNTPFACVDYALAVDDKGNVLPPPPNVAALKFREEEGSFLVGALAALVGKSKKVGFVGGMDIPLIHKFEAGYRAGVKQVCPDCEVIAQYAGVTPDAFKNPGKGKELALAQIAKGADVIFTAAGNSGLGAFDAVEAAGTDARGRATHFVIGVDSNQDMIKPGFVLTSMVKRVHNAVYQIVSDVAAGKFHGGLHVFGLDTDGVGYTVDDDNRGLLTTDALAAAETAKREIIDGEIKVTDAMGQ